MKGILSWAWNVKGLQPAPRIVLMALASRADNDTFDCWPSRKLLADDCNMSVASLKRHVAFLCKIGVLEVECRFRENGSKSSNRYILKAGIEYSNAHNGRVQIEPTPLDPAENVMGQIEPRVQIEPRGGVKNDPSRTLTGLPSSEAKASSDNSAPRKASLKPDNVSVEVWNDFVAHRKAKKASVSQTAINGIAREADRAGWPLEDALAECVARGWQGFKADWVKQNGGNNRNGNVTESAVAGARARMAKSQGSGSPGDRGSGVDRIGEMPNALRAIGHVSR